MEAWVSISINLLNTIVYSYQLKTFKITKTTQFPIHFQMFQQIQLDL